jgi:hypothetical protein
MNIGRKMMNRASYGGLMLDTMLGRLARWLRILRFDARYYPKGPDEQLVALTLRESRVLVTKDRLLTLQRPPVAFYLLHSNVVRDQLLEIAPLLKFLEPTRVMGGLCTVCNARLLVTPKRQVIGRIPTHVARNMERFWTCPGCGRVYYQASHQRLMRRFLEDLNGFARYLEGG